MFGVEAGFTVGQNGAACIAVGGSVLLIEASIAAVDVLQFLGAKLSPFRQARGALAVGFSWVSGCVVLALDLGSKSRALLGGRQLDELPGKNVLLEVHPARCARLLDVDVLALGALVPGARLAVLGGQLLEVLESVYATFKHLHQDSVFKFSVRPLE